MVLPLPWSTLPMLIPGVRLRMARCEFTPSERSMVPMAPRQAPLWATMVQMIFPVPGMLRASMKVPGLSTRLP